MLSGIETAGLVLAALPLIISGELTPAPGRETVLKAADLSCMQP